MTPSAAPGTSIGTRHSAATAAATTTATIEWSSPPRSASRPSNAMTAIEADAALPADIGTRCSGPNGSARRAWKVLLRSKETGTRPSRTAK